MKMEELEGKRVKISAGTITVKDENDKTRGMVRNVKTWARFSNREQFDHHKAITAAGIWGANIDGLMDCVVLDGNALYYLNNTKALADYEKYFAGRDNFQTEKANYEKRLKIAKKAAEYMTVINCHIIK